MIHAPVHQHHHQHHQTTLHTPVVLTVPPSTPQALESSTLVVASKGPTTAAQAHRTPLLQQHQHQQQQQAPPECMASYGTTTSRSNKPPLEVSTVTPSRAPPSQPQPPPPPILPPETVRACNRVLNRIMGSATQFTITFLDALVTGALIPELPALAATLTDASENVPLVIALIAGGLFLGRAGGALWWHYRHPATHPSARGDMASSLKAVLVAAFIYSVVWFLQGFLNRLSMFFLGQFVIGWVMGGHAVKVRASALAVLLGIMIGPLIGGLYDAQHTLDPCPEGEGNTCTRWASGAPMAPIGVAVLALAAVTGMLSISVSHCEPVGVGGGGGGLHGEQHLLDAAHYRRLEGASPAPGDHHASSSSSSSSAAGRMEAGLSTQELMAAIADAERTSAAHHNHLHILVIPPRYVKGCNNDMDEAARRWKETLAWRADAKVDGILTEPQRNFRLIKECYPHFLHRRDKGGRPIYYELLGTSFLLSIHPPTYCLSPPMHAKPTHPPTSPKVKSI